MAKDLVYYVTNSNAERIYEVPSIIENYGDSVKILTTKSALTDMLLQQRPDIIICDRCSFLLTESQIAFMQNNCFNIHPSFLPYNRGYHPNFWSFYDKTPSGVTIHAFDSSIDRGGILVQAEITIPDHETLRSSYYVLRDLSVALFKVAYPLIKSRYHNLSFKSNDSSKGNIHYKRNFNGVFELLPQGWDTSVAYVRKMKADGIKIGL